MAQSITFGRTPTPTHAGPIALAGLAGLTLGLLANLARKGVVQAPTVFAGSWDEALAAEHRATLALIDRIERTDSSQTMLRPVLLTQLKHALSKHSFQEETTVYAMLRLRGMAEPATSLNDEHGVIKQLLFELTELPDSDPRWLGKIGELRAALEPHMRTEEQEVFPRLRAALGEAENHHLTVAMNKEGLKVA
jgi:iron-sulfur cluster repair protein YtfE (RIC family)